jgi:hypothetical protein
MHQRQPPTTLCNAVLQTFGDAHQHSFFYNYAPPAESMVNTVNDAVNIWREKQGAVKALAKAAENATLTS